MWIKPIDAAKLENVSERSIRRNVKDGKYGKEGEGFRYVRGVGRGGWTIEITLERISADAQARYHGEAEQKSYEAILSLTDDQRDAVFYKQSVVREYHDFKATYPKADKLEAFLQQYNDKHPDKTVSKRQLIHWQKLYKQDGIDGLVDRRGGYNKGQCSIPKNVQDVFLAYWLKEKGTNRGGPSVTSCYKLTQMNFPNMELPSLSTFERLTLRIPLPTKILAREGKKAFEDKCMPYIPFDYNSIHTNQQWVADNHIFDVMVKFPDGSIRRPWLLGWMDRRSRCIVGYVIIEKDPNSDHILDGFARAVNDFGIPESVLTDNGADYRVHDLFDRNAMYSLANEMTISVTHAIPYNAKAKLIERFFNTLEYSYYVHLPSYIGANPKRRPEKMQTVNDKLKKSDDVISYDDFVKVTEKVIEKYNTTAHSGAGMNGKTPYQAFEDCITVPIRTANSILLSMYFKRTSRLLSVGRNGVRVPELGQYYDSSELYKHQGKKIYAKYNTNDVRHVFCISEKGEFLCTATSKEFGTLDHEVTAQNNRLLNHEKKRRRALTKALIPDVKVPSFEQLILKDETIDKKPNLKLLKTAQMVNSTQQDKATVMIAAEQAQKLTADQKAKKGRTKQQVDDAYYKHMIGG